MSIKNKATIEESINIPENVQVDIIQGLIKISGPEGSNERKLIDPSLIIEKGDKKIILKAKKQTRNEKRIVMTFKSHLNNMIRGVIKNYFYKLKICSGHFPMNVSLSNDKVIIKNFFAEKIPREANILKDVKVKIDGEIITVTGSNKELVGQTAANIEQACRITNKDRRIFMDGIYITSKDQD